jgi:outer membrane biosynthesis protein TonB
LRHHVIVTQSSVRPNPLRFSRPDFNRVLAALAVALALHLLGYGGYRLEKAYGWLERIPSPHWLTKARQKLVIPLAPRPPAQHEIPLTFVEVNPDQAVTQAPKNAKYYSAKSSRAANPDADKESNQPKISGHQNKMVQTEDVARSKAFPLQPSARPQPQSQPERQAQAEAKKSQTPGDLAFAKPDTELRPENNQEQSPSQPKPRTIAEALARPENSALAQERLQQEGGVDHRAQLSALDVAGTSFGEYDEELIRAIQNRWYELLDAQKLTRLTGRVVLEFHLHDDGSITDMTVQESSVDELLGALCQRAVIDPAPYAAWPSDMRRQIGVSFRDLRFTFYYE